MVAVYGPQSYENDMRLSHSQSVVKTVQNGRTRSPVYPPKSLKYQGVETPRFNVRLLPWRTRCVLWQLNVPTSHCPCGASTTMVGAVEQIEGPTLDELRMLARWLRLRDQTVPPPTVGDIEADPSRVADLYGVKGMSVLTAFVNMEDLSCRVCPFKARTVQLAVLHQQQANHFQA